jgi:hypothetical protein
MDLVQDRVQWRVFLLAVFEITGSVHFTFCVNNNCRNDSISVSLPNCAQEGVPNHNQSTILECTYGLQVFFFLHCNLCRSQWPCSLRRRSSATRLLRSGVRIPPGSWVFVCCECCVLSGRGLCHGLITRPEESYRLWRVVVCDQETPKTRRLKPATGLQKKQPDGL